VDRCQWTGDKDLSNRVRPIGYRQDHDSPLGTGLRAFHGEHLRRAIPFFQEILCSSWYSVPLRNDRIHASEQLRAAAGIGAHAGAEIVIREQRGIGRVVDIRGEGVESISRHNGSRRFEFVVKIANEVTLQ